jgi:hypothetical protein
MANLANATREWAKANSIPVPARGRVSKVTVVSFLRAHPATLRALAQANGIPVGLRGRIAPEVAEAVAAL